MTRLQPGVRPFLTVPLYLAVLAALVGALLTASPRPASAAVTTPGGYTALSPARLLDTRTGLGAARATVAAKATVHLQVTGRGGVPTSGVSSVALNVTVTSPTAAGFLTAYPDATARPGTSNLNFTRGTTTTNLVVVPVGANGRVALYNGSPGTIHLVADVFGYHRGSFVPPSPGPFVGKGFDACTAPPPDVMAAWRAASPYRAVGIYMGGNNRACAQPELTAAWVAQQRSAGWHLIPIYLGDQPYCTTSSKINRFTAANAAAAGRAAADDAVVRAGALGLAVGSTIFNDIEAYRTDDPTCTNAVLSFMNAWTVRLHERGFASGFYSSLGSGVRDQVAAYDKPGYTRPDYLWFARYDGVATVSDPSIPSSYWPHRRLKQYQSPAQTGGPETYGGKTLFVDRNQIDLGS